MKKTLLSLITLASCLLMESCSQCRERDSDCVCKPDCAVVEKHCGCEESCVCRIP